VLWIIDQDGTGLRRLTDPLPCVDRASSPRFSPDGTTIAYGGYFDSAAGINSDESEVGAIGVDGKRAHPAACSDC
jgi:Tol biopolymer transport system component